MYIRMVCSLLLLAAAACYQDKTVGVSEGNRPDPPAPAKPKVATRIQGQPGEILTFDSPNAGDMDGDGYDDFVLASERLNDDGVIDDAHKALYLFYGRAEFPAQISTADADAVFDAELGMSFPIGDLNGDGLGDLLLVRHQLVEFVFGSKQRFQGAVAPESGTVWRAGELPPPFAPGFSTQFMVQRAGDVNGDGCADLIVTATTLLAPADDGTGGGLTMRSYLVRGHRGEWRPAVWDPIWASSGFGFDPSGFGGVEAAQIMPARAGDLDGDGRDDLLAMTGNGSLLFYGKNEYPSELSSREADARLLPAVPTEPDFPGFDLGPRFIAAGFGDLDGDGRSDLALLDELNSALRFVYGRHWSGDSQIDAEFEIAFEAPGQHSIGGIAAGDIDGDALPELLLSVASYGGPSDFGGELQEPPEPQEPQASIYVLRGTGERQRGKRQLTKDDRWHAPALASSTLPPGPNGLFTISLGGDVDGDGGQDVLTSLLARDNSGGADVSVVLVPSTPRSPD